MSTTTTPAPAAPSTPVPAAGPAVTPTGQKKGRVAGQPVKTVSIRLASSGEAEVMVLGQQLKDKSWTVSAFIYTKKAVKGTRRTGEKGCTTSAKDLASAKKAAEVIAAGFVKAGWTRPEPKPFGFAAKPDAFSLKDIPAPKK